MDLEPDFVAFLRRERPVQAVTSDTPWVHALLDLLRDQGCIGLSVQDLCSVDGVARLHSRFSNFWYSFYYAHPIWARLRTDLSAGLFAQWAKRTYYLSKSAGATAARSLVCSNRGSVRSAFLKSALEEYAHHHSFYSLRPLLDQLGQSEVATQGPTPGCVAFDDQMLSIAANDDCAHVFVALFQEKTAQFSRQANDFYNFVEDKLGIPGALKGWRTHISFDQEHGHTTDLEELLKDFVEMPEESLYISVLRASATIEFLVESLNELERYSWISPEVQVSEDLRKEVLLGLGHVVAAALSHCIEHPRLLVALGRVLEALSSRHSVELQRRHPTRLATVAVLGRLEHLSTQPVRFTETLAFVLARLGERQLLIALGSATEVSTDTHMHRDAEMLSYALTTWDRPIKVPQW